MSNPNFSAVYSTNNIWRDIDMERCLTDDLDAMDIAIASKAASTHTHDGYAATDHTHSGYASVSDVTQLQTLVGDTSVASQISTAVSGKADTNHTHTVANITGLSDELDSKYEKASTGIPKTDFSSDVQASLGKADTAIQSLNHSHSCASATSPGFISNEDQLKLNTVEVCANRTIVDSALSDTSENPVQNKVIKAAIDAIMAKTAVSISVANESLQNLGKNCYYYPSFGIVLLRMYGITTQAMEAGTSYTLASVSTNIPANNHALAIKCSSKAFSALVSSAGNINVTPHADVSAGQSIYIAGFWFV